MPPLRPAALLAALAMLALLPAAARAAPPLVFHDTFRESIEDDEVCGIPVDVTVGGAFAFQVFFDQAGNVTRVASTGSFSAVFTSQLTGKTATLSSGGLVTTTVVENPDGTVTFVDTFIGLPEKIAARGPGGTELRDAGVITFATTVDFETGEATTEVVVAKGPHPEAESDFALFCAALTAALT